MKIIKYYVLYVINDEEESIKTSAVEISKDVVMSADDIVNAIKTEILKAIPIEERQDEALEVTLLNISKL
jgi:hypothetical protein